jgi:hypothetical protein
MNLIGRNIVTARTATGSGMFTVVTHENQDQHVQHPENRKRGIVSFIVSQKYSAEQGDYDDRCLTSHPTGRMRATGGQG